MGCNCKKDKTGISIENQSSEKIKQPIIHYVLKTFGFLLMLVLLPIINIAIIWFIFRTLVLNKDVDIKPLISMIGKSFKNKEEDEEEDDDEQLTEDDVIMLDVEEIKKK